MIYRMNMGELDNWVKHKAKAGDIAFSKDPHTEHEYMYVYKGPDLKPFWVMIQEDRIDKYLEEMNNLKIEEPKMEKRCDNCKYFNGVTMSKIIDYWCSHEKYSGTRVAAHTSCAEYEQKEELTTPFDGVRLYLINACTGEIGIRYICEDCGKEMKKPYHWWLTLPINNKPKHRPGYHFRCEECDKKKEGKI